MTLDINYWNLCGHEPMLQDTIRCHAFREALEEAVKPGCAVLDIGAGTGILSMFAAQAGARVVYAVERTGVTSLAREIIADNGFADRIQVIHQDIQDVKLPEKVDVIVSEWLGGYAVEENLLPIVVQARDRWLKPGGTMIPGKVTSWLAPVYDPHLRQDLDFWRSYAYGFEYKAAGRAACRDYRCGCNHVKTENLVSPGQEMWLVDSINFPYAKSLEPFVCHLEFVADRATQFNGLAAWFRADLGRTLVLDIGPDHGDTHWGRTVFPIDTTLNVTAGTRIVVDFEMVPLTIGASLAKWDVTVGDYHFRSEAGTAVVG